MLFLSSVQFSHSVVSDSLRHSKEWTAARQASLSITNSLADLKSSKDISQLYYWQTQDSSLRRVLSLEAGPWKWGGTSETGDRGVVGSGVGGGLVKGGSLNWATSLPFF